MTSVTQSSQTESLGYRELRNALISGAEHLQANSHILDRLNVFPVPDGDTGSNMVVTFLAGIEAIRAVEINSIRELSHRMSPALLKNSRGNSGFILARFFSGFFETASAHDRLNSTLMSESFANGSYQVATSLYSPVEGTAVTIIAAMTDAMGADQSLPPVDALRHAIAHARETLKKTPDMLPVLARAGVVDSGALGFIMLMEGLVAGITNDPLPVESEAPYRFEPRTGDASEGLDDGLPVNVDAAEPEFFRYCTEVIVSDFAGMSQTDLKQYLSARGNSIALVMEEGLLKLHIHTDDPQELIDHLSNLGTVEKTKVEDMLEQMRLVARESGKAQAATSGVLAIVPGDGFGGLFADLGIVNSLVYTESLPTAGEIQTRLEQMEAEHVLILPNNSNILPAAMVARDHTAKTVSILPTSHIVQGLTAAYGYSENSTAADNMTSMQECLHLAEALFVYRADRDSRYHKTEIRAGEVFVIQEDRILATGDSLSETVCAALGQFDLEERANITLFSGSSADPDDVQAVQQELAARYPDLEVEHHRGGQPREIFIVSVE